MINIPIFELTLFAAPNPAKANGTAVHIPQKSSRMSIFNSSFH